MLTNHLQGLVEFTWEQFHMKYARCLPLILFQIYQFKIIGTHPRGQRVNINSQWYFASFGSTSRFKYNPGTNQYTVWHVSVSFMINHIFYWFWNSSTINTLRPRQNGPHLADYTFKCIFFKENVRILIKISLKFVPKSPMDNIPAMFQIMAWRRGDKPLSEAMMVSLLTHICVARLE